MNKIERYLIKADDNVVTRVIAAFESIADKQRGAPEQAMLKVQFANGGGVLNPLVEHVGDILHRMTMHVKYIDGSPLERCGYEYVKNKVERNLLRLTNSYGFAQEMQENFISNARYLKEHPRNGKSPTADELKEEVYAALDNYAAEHAKLPVYNAMHFLARQAAIDIGNRQFYNATKALTMLQGRLQVPETFARSCLDYYLFKDGRLYEWKPIQEINLPKHNLLDS